MRDMDDDTTDDMDDGMGGSMDGDAALGDSAHTRLLAEVVVDQLPAEPLSWTGFRLESDTTHTHDRSFVFAHDRAHTVVIDGQRNQVAAGESVAIPPGSEHSHQGGAWEVLLSEPGVEAPTGASPEPLFTSGALEGIPETPVQLRFLLVELPPGSQTSVHTHPGPEYVYNTRGSYTYESDATGEVPTSEGDDHSLGADTAVQKRNTGDEPATFLSWFIVDPDEPFAAGATFDTP